MVVLYVFLYTPWSNKNKKVAVLFFEQLRETLADFDNFWHATSRKNLTQMTSYGQLTLILSLHYLVKCRSRSLAVYNNEFILCSVRIGSEMINWMATNAIGNYCLSKSHTCHIALFFITACAQNVSHQQKRQRQTSTLRANSMFNNCMTRNVSLAVDA